MRDLPEEAPGGVSERLTVEQIEMMLRITANAVAHGEAHLLPLLNRLEKDYAFAKNNDPATHAKQLLANLDR